MKKMLKIIVIFIVVIVLVLAGLVWFSTRPISKEEAVSTIRALLEKEVSQNEVVSSGLVYIESASYELSEMFAEGSENGLAVGIDQPFHVASVGKAFTATLIGMLVDEGKVSLEDPISGYLSEEVLEGLFIFEGKDYKDEVTLKQLLNHTSGVADYFEGEVVGSEPMIDLVINEPNRFFTPLDLVDFTREYQKAVGMPGERYLYSDTGYILLGLIIEEVSDREFHELLHERIFDPLQMNDSYLSFYSEPRNPSKEIADIWLDGTEISGYKSLSVDWAGGGLVSTLEDLGTFVKALNRGAIIQRETLDSLYQFDYKFMKGIHYGNGFMEYHFGEFFPTLSSMPKLRGHMGILGTQMFYDEETETTFVCSFGSTDYAAGSVKTMIQILATVSRIKE